MRLKGFTDTEEESKFSVQLRKIESSAAPQSKELLPFWFSTLHQCFTDCASLSLQLLSKFLVIKMKLCYLLSQL